MNRQKKNFCTECGSPTEERFVGWYDAESGEGMTVSSCTKNPCHMWNHQGRPRPWWKLGDEQCTVCGKVIYFGEY